MPIGRRIEAGLLDWPSKKNIDEFSEDNREEHPYFVEDEPLLNSPTHSNEDKSNETNVTEGATIGFTDRKRLLGCRFHMFSILMLSFLFWLPDIVIVLDQQKEYIALQECAILGIPTISLVDTNCDPDLANISIPANDDTMTSIRLILNKLYNFPMLLGLLINENPGNQG
ncbi:hypothetical protein ACJX0J_013042 [Zea mays]